MEVVIHDSLIPRCLNSISKEKKSTTLGRCFDKFSEKIQIVIVGGDWTVACGYARISCNRSTCDLCHLHWCHASTR